MLRTVPLASAILAAIPAAFAQEQTTSGGLEEIIVTAQKREESLQDVPLSVAAFDTARLEEWRVNDFNDYVKFLPSAAYQSLGPGFARVFMRGVASGDNGNHSGPLPSVGQYLDEQPITTIQGALDIHMYDIARVESLAGPQGTLFGASSQAGTIRIITNKPDPSGFSAAYDVQGNVVDHGDAGYQGEGYVNVPISENAAIRLVGWYEHDGGYIDNVLGTRTYPTAGVPISNARRAENNYNDVDTYGGRAALKIDLNDNWTVTPQIMGQIQKSHGIFGFDPKVGELKVTHFFPESSDDRWYQAALTVEGKISNFDLVYAGSYLHRNDDVESDYSDYSFFYDQCCGYGAYWYDNTGTPLADPGQFIQGKDRYTKQSHELRLSSPTDWRVRFVGGLFYQRQEHGIEQRYLINDLADSLEVTGWPDTLWLTEQKRVDRDRAIFGELTLDVTDKLSLIGGLRFFKARNSLKGFFGFGSGYSGSTGEAACFLPRDAFRGAPCVNLDKVVDEGDMTHRVTAQYKFDDDRMVYFTWSRGFRPGGVNRRGTFPPYSSDFLTNYEVGWKTTWANDTFRFNGAFFEEDWDNFQFSFLGANGLTNITNAGQARIRGVETDISWAASDHLTVFGGLSLLQPELVQDFCKVLDANGNPLPKALCPPDDFAADGTRLPVTSEVKGNVTARYTWEVGTFDANVQGSLVYTGDATSALLPSERSILGKQDAYTTLDLSAGLARDNYSLELFLENAFDERGDTYRYAECQTSVCGAQTYSVTNRPRLIGIKFGQKF